MVTEKDVKDRLALVTGAAGVLGESITRQLLDDGNRVIMVDVNGDRLDALAQRFGDNAIPMVLDVADPTAVNDACDWIRKTHGNVSVLVNNAGVFSKYKAVETTVEEWRRVMGINLDGAFFLSQQWLPSMRGARWGRIINILSLGIKTGGLTAGTSYVTAKGGLAVLTFSLARESAAEGITVNGIAPGFVLTPMVTHELTEEQRQNLLAQIPIRRFCEADEVANLVSFIASPKASYITGEIFDINGGQYTD